MTVTEINEKFKELMERLSKVVTDIQQLDTLRIQLVYTYTPPNPETRTPNNEGLIEITDIVPFVTDCWSKLSVYNGVYCNLGAGYFFQFNGEKVKNGDFLIKKPNNAVLLISGSTPYYYEPTDYSVDGQLIFSLTSTGAQSHSVSMPKWATGSPRGHIFTWSGSSSITIDYSSNNLTEEAARGGRYFVNNQEIIFPPNTITIDTSNHLITLPTAVTSCYIPYIA